MEETEAIRTSKYLRTRISSRLPTCEYDVVKGTGQLQARRPPEETWEDQPLGTVQTSPQTQPGAQVLGVGLTLAGVLGADASAGLFN